MSALGHFEPSFYGVTTHLWTDEHVATLWAYAGTEDVGAWANAIGDSSLSHLGPISALDHEVRHFHDALLSPWGCNIMGLRLQILINGMQVLGAVAEAPGRFLPTPLSRWLGWDAEARRRWIAETGGAFGVSDLSDLVDLPLPDLSPAAAPNANADPLPSQIWMCIDAERRLREVRARRPSPLGSGNIACDDAFEACAHVIQGQAIWQGQGAAAADTYLRHLESADLPYLVPFQMVGAALGRSGGPVPFHRLSELYSWTLLCDPEPNSEYDPAFRLAGIVALAVAEPDLLRAEKNTLALWDSLDERLGLTNWRDNLARADAMADRRAEVYGRMRRSPGSNQLRPALDVADTWLADRTVLLRAFRADVDAYISPERYLNDQGETWPTPAFQLRFGGRAHHRDTPLDSHSIRAITADAEELKAIAYIRVEQPERLDPIVDYALVNALVNHCFFEMPAHDLMEQNVRRQLAAVSGKELLHVY